MIFARKIYKIPELYMIFARKMPEFYTIIARKIFFPNFRVGGARAPCPRLLRLCKTLTVKNDVRRPVKNLTLKSQAYTIYDGHKP